MIIFRVALLGLAGGFLAFHLDSLDAAPTPRSCATHCTLLAAWGLVALGQLIHLVWGEDIKG